MPIPDEREDFWAFSVSTYPSARDQFLWLQNQAGLEVNIVLLCCWAADRGRQLGAVELGAVLQAVEEWNTHVVRPIRAMRLWMKPMESNPEVKHFRNTVVALELESEKLAQGFMVDVLERGKSRSFSDGFDVVELAVINLTSYLHVSELDIGYQPQRVMAKLVSGVFRKPDGPAIIKMFQRSLDANCRVY